MKTGNKTPYLHQEADASSSHLLSDRSTSVATITAFQGQLQQENLLNSQPMPLATKPIYRKRAEPTAGLIRGPSQYTKSQQFRGFNQPMPSLVIGAAARSRPDALSNSTFSGRGYLGGNFGRSNAFQQPRKHRTRRQLISDELSYEQHTLNTIAEKIKRQIEQLQIEEAILIHMLRVGKEQVDEEMKIRDQNYYRGLKGKGRPAITTTDSLPVHEQTYAPSRVGKRGIIADNEKTDIDLNLNIMDHSLGMSVSHIHGNDIESEIYEIHSSPSEVSEDEDSMHQANSETERAALRGLLEQYGNELF